MDKQRHDEQPNTSGVSFGVGPVDARLGELAPGGVYLLAGRPGPAKLVGALQFLHAGILQQARGLLLTTSDGAGILDVARGWGFEMDSAWREGRLEILGFREDFEMRILRSAVPEDAVEELDHLVGRDFARIAIDPGSMFLHGGARTALGRAFLDWARNHPATFCVTLPIDSTDGLPSAAEWLVHQTDGVFLIDRQPDGLYQLRVDDAFPTSVGSEELITLQLKRGVGLILPEDLPSRRRSDGRAGAADRVLILSLDESGQRELGSWAEEIFSTEIVMEPLDALARIQTADPFGGVLIHTPRRKMREAIRTCRAMRPLTDAAIVVASDDSVRSTDRVELLDAGADDCLSGGIDFRELGARVRKAVAIGGQTIVAEPVEAPDKRANLGGLVAQEAFVEEAKRRAADSEQSRFSLIQFKATPALAMSVGTVLAGEVRGEDGDLVTCTSDGCWVLLQGARRDPANAFLARARQKVKEHLGEGSEPASNLLVNPADKILIEIMLAKANQPKDLSTARSGSGDQDV